MALVISCLNVKRIKTDYFPADENLFLAVKKMKDKMCG